MRNQKSVNIIVVFGVFTLLVIFQSFNVNKKNSKKKDLLKVQKDSETIFNKLNYYSVENSKPVLSLNADQLKIINSESLYFIKPDGFLLNTKQEKIEYQAEKGSYKTKGKLLNLEGLVSLISKKGEHKSEKLQFDGIKTVSYTHLTLPTTPYV